MRRTLRLLLVNLFSSLGYSLGAVQALLVCWLDAVLGSDAFGWRGGLALAVALTAGNALALPFLRRARRGAGWRRALARLYIALGLVSFLLGAALLVCGVVLVPLGALLEAAGVPGGSGLFRVLSSVVLGSMLAMLIWGFTIGQATIDYTHLAVPLAGLDPSLDGLRIVQISDIHIGNGMEGRRLRGLVERVNALDPDVVAISGDIFDFDPRFLEEGARGLAGLRARHGVYAVLGNHDGYTGADAVAGALAEYAPRLEVLRGDVVRLPTEAPLYVAGIDDPGHRLAESEADLPELEDLGRRLPDDGPVLLLIHRPEAFGQAARYGFPLVLAGHTHGGQIALPSRDGALNIARAIYRYHRGSYRAGGSLLYVNRGVGVAGPAIRLNCPREIATIQLEAAPRGASPARRSPGSA